MLALIVGLPTVLLIAADLRELARDRAFVRASLLLAHRTQVAALASDIASQLRRRLARLHPPHDAAEGARLAAELSEEKPFVRETFWIDQEARLGGTIPLPAPGKIADLPQPVGAGDPLAADAALREGTHSEYALRDRDAATGAYRRALLLSREVGVRTQASFSLGRLAEQAGKPVEAATFYRAAAQLLGDSRNAAGIPYGLIAELRLAAIAPELSDIASLRSRLAVALAPDEAMAFSAYLDRNLRQAGSGAEIRSNKARAAPSGPLPAILAGDLQELVWPAIRGRDFQLPAWVRVAGPDGLRLYGVAGTLLDGYVGFRVDLSAISAVHVPRWAKRVGLDPAAHAALHVEGGSATSSLEAILEPPFEFMRVTIQLKEDAVDQRLAAQSRRSLVALGLILLTIGAGAWALYRGISRELTFARMQAAFVAGVSHELKTPLTAIKMYAELLALGLAKVPESAASIVLAESDRLARLIDRVLDFARIQRGLKIYNPTMVVVDEIIDEALVILEPLISEESFQVKIVAATKLPPIFADRDALLQVILNLLSNARKFSGAARQISIRLEATENEFLLAVTDQGCGIPQREIRRIFEPFHRAVPPDGPAGSGLGLSLVREYVTAHGGRITVSSEVGKGSTFQVYWPIGSNKTMPDGSNVSVNGD
ncbi:MAG: HAMP domain-containing histidine kinase [Cyanobacteria bacterium NC_groundwater_1444_Ag_S-0.65um_54_12]|nr:HAMP domain-containing histidine kinase [Cyanobacteria bacterium NC_groundwater_1444_Ag_S-0.65um_54_12]